ncbi:MAG: hypothetical protein HY700_20195 [Gemmatimonadetes bacterium]|nr:hypothetical protein [Gemmatimonadota bacterium]
MQRARPANPHAADGTPPFPLPGEHFAAALLWLALGAAGLVVVAPSLAEGDFLSPRVIAVTHCFTLGWITTSIFGALYQIFPVALGVPARSVRMGHATFWVLQAGVAAVVAGSWWRLPLGIAVGWVLLFLAVGGLSWNLLPQRRRATRGRTLGLYASAGHMALGLAMFVVAARIGAALGWWPLDRLGFLVAHAHLAVAGFATLTAVGVGSRMLPMFLLSHGHQEWPLRWIGPATGAGLTVFSAGKLLRLPALADVGGIILALGMGLYLYLAAGYFRHRTRRPLDPGMAIVAAAFGYLALAVLLGLILLALPGFRPTLIAAYGLAGILGWVSLLIVGIYHKIVPFLTWMHRFGTRIGEPGIPRVADLTSIPAAWVTASLYAGGVALLVLGALTGRTFTAVAGALGFACGTLVLLGQNLYLAVRR